MKKLILAVGFLLLVLLGCSGAKSRQANRPQKDGPPFYYQALSDIEAGKFRAALADLDSAIYYNPTLAQSYQLKGWLYEQLGKPDSAVLVYRTGLNYKSYFPEVWTRLGRLLLHSGEYREAAVYFKKAVGYYPDSTQLYLELAEAYYRMDRPALSMDNLRAYRKAVQNPQPAYWKWLGLSAYKIGRYPRAREALRKYVRLQNDDPLAHKVLGLTLFQLQDYHQAVSSFNTAEQLGGFDPEIVVYRSRYFKMFNKPGAAWQELQDGLSRDSLSIPILMEAGLWKFEEGDPGAAREYFIRVIGIDSSHWRAYRYLGLIAEQDGNPSLARQYYTTYLKHTYEQDDEITGRLKKLLEQGAP